MTKGIKLELAGRRFGRLTAIKPVKRNRWSQVIWQFRCDCGVEKDILGSLVNLGTIRSCGCLRLDIITKHGLARHPLYQRWTNMMDRCYKKTDINYKNYGARGIKVCDRWHDVRNFVGDNERLVSPGLELDRINNDGPYSPVNCRWATRLEQANNKRNGPNRRITFRGETKTLKQWSQKLRIPNTTLHNRLTYLGWTLERAFTTPARFAKM